MAREKELRRSLAVFPIGTVMKLTDLTDRLDSSPDSLL